MLNEAVHAKGPCGCAESESKRRRFIKTNPARDAMLPCWRRCKINSANSNIYTHDVIQWLDKLEKTQPFLLTGAGFDWWEGKFTKTLVDSKKLAKQMYEFSPDIVSQGTGDMSRLALELTKHSASSFGGIRPKDSK